MNPNALILGHSHLRVIKLAAEASGVDWLRFIPVREAEYTPFFENGRVNANVLAAITRSQDTETAACFFHIHGNHHNTLGMVKHPRNYDFVLKEEPNLSLQTSAEIIPYHQMASIFRQSIAFSIIAPLKQMIGLIHCPTFFLETHPTIPCADYIAATGIFQELIEKHGVAPAVQRYKLWRLHNLVLREECAKLGVGYLPCPTMAMDENNYLLETYWGVQGVHGNEQYGSLVIENLKNHIQELAHRHAG